VDPLSRLPRAPPSHISPVEPDKPSICTKETLDERQEVTPAEKFVAFSFAAWSIEDCLDNSREAMINVRSRNKKTTEAQDVPVAKDSEWENSDELDMLETTAEYWGAVNPPLMIHLAMSEDAKNQWRSAYLNDPMFKSIVQGDKNQYDKMTLGRQFFMDNDGMIFFNNEDYQPRLCVPTDQQNFILREAHENPLESVHTGPECLWQSLSSRFYWKRMKLDIIKYC